MNKAHKSLCGSADIAAQLVLKTEIAEFDRLRSWFQDFAGQLKLPEEITDRMLIAADEVFTNIAAYAYSGATGQVEVSAEQDSAVLHLTFKDTGKPEHRSVERHSVEPVEIEGYLLVRLHLLKINEEELSYKNSIDALKTINLFNYDDSKYSNVIIPLMKNICEEIKKFIKCRYGEVL